MVMDRQKMDELLNKMNSQKEELEKERHTMNMTKA